jgi:hypothetical protein
VLDSHIEAQTSREGSRGNRSASGRRTNEPTSASPLFSRERAAEKRRFSQVEANREAAGG